MAVVMTRLIRIATVAICSIVAVAVAVDGFVPTITSATAIPSKLSSTSSSSWMLSSTTSSEEYEILRSCQLWNAGSRTKTSPIKIDDDDNQGSNNNKKEGENKKSLVVLLPQLGEFDSSEFCEQLVAVFSNEFKKKTKEEGGGFSIELSVIGIAGAAGGAGGDDDDDDGDSTSTSSIVAAADRFCDFTGLDPNCLFIDPDATVHRRLGLYSGPGFHVPDSVSDDVIRFVLNTLPGGAPSSDGDSKELRQVAGGWLNYLAMCAGIGAPGTLPEIIRGYLGDTSAPERFRDDDVVKVNALGGIEIGPGVGAVRLGPLVKYNQWFADERGYQRPVELVTVRLKNMVEVLENWNEYVSNPSLVSQRGATFLFDNDGTKLYEYRHRGVLTYSETMARPLTFLAPYIGEEKARNPLGLPDNKDSKNNNAGKNAPRGILKPAGKAMNLLSSIFKFETKLQSQIVGVTDSDILKANDEINDMIQASPVVIFTYGLSPFSSQAVKLLQDVCIDVIEDSGHNDTDLDSTLTVDEIGLEWFLLTDVESCSKRSALLEMAGQSSLPHIFIGGKHLGGLFNSPDGGGIAGLQETGKLKDMIDEAVMAASQTSTAKA